MLALSKVSCQSLYGGTSFHFLRNKKLPLIESLHSCLLCWKICQPREQPLQCSSISLQFCVILWHRHYYFYVRTQSSLHRILASKRDTFIKRLFDVSKDLSVSLHDYSMIGNLLDAFLSVFIQMFGITWQKECPSVALLSVLKALYEYTWDQVTKIYFFLAFLFTTQSCLYYWITQQTTTVIQMVTHIRWITSPRQLWSLHSNHISNHTWESLSRNITSLLHLFIFEPWYEVMNKEKKRVE